MSALVQIFPVPLLTRCEPSGASQSRTPQYSTLRRVDRPDPPSPGTVRHGLASRGVYISFCDSL